MVIDLIRSDLCNLFPNDAFMEKKKKPPKLIDSCINCKQSFNKKEGLITAIKSDKRTNGYNA